MALAALEGFWGGLEVLGLELLRPESFGATIDAQPSATQETEGLTWFVEFLSDPSRLSPIPRIFLCGFLVRLVLDSVLLKVWVAQVFFQRADEGDGCLFLYVR